MTTRLWSRRVTIVVGGTEIVNSRALEGGPIQIGGVPAGNFSVRFSITRTLQSAANTATVEILNLGEQTRGAMQKRGEPFLIQAGYLDAEGGLFSGQVEFASSTNTGTEVVTRVQGADGLRAMRAPLSVSLGEGSTLSDLITKIAEQMGVSAAKALAKIRQGQFSAGLQAFANGMALSGDARTELDHLGQTYRFDWSIQDGELVLLRRDDATDESAPLVSPTTGLVRSPETAVDSKRPGRHVLKVQSLLNPAIRPGRKVQIESSFAAGVYKVESVSHTGDTSGEAWYTDFVGVEA